MKKIFLLIFLFITKITIAQIPEPQKNTYVNDFAHVLTADQAAVLNQGIFAIEKKSGIQLAIVLVDKVPAQYDMEEFALLIGRKWHVGKNEDGIVYVAAIQQHKQRFEIARRLDNTFSNEKSQSILAAIKPYFKQKDYNGGLQELISQVDSAVGANVKNTDTTQNAATAATAATTAQSDNDGGGPFDFWIGLGAVVMMIVLIIYFTRRSRRRRMTNFNNGPGGFNDGTMYNPGGGIGNSGVGGFVAGAALGAAAGYVASEIADSMNNNQGQQQDNIPADNSANTDNDNSSQDDNNSSNWGNWGSDSSDDSSSDSGFSGGDFSSDGGGGSDW